MAEAEVHVYPKRSSEWQEEWAWGMTKAMKELDSKLNLLLGQHQVDSKASGNTPITNELAAAITMTRTISRGIDRQVPDQRRTVLEQHPRPPHKKPAKRKQVRKPIKKRK